MRPDQMPRQPFADDDVTDLPPEVREAIPSAEDVLYGHTVGPQGGLHSFVHGNPNGATKLIRALQQERDSLRAYCERVTADSARNTLLAGRNGTACAAALDRAEKAEAERDRLRDSMEFYKHRCEALQAVQSAMRDPERKAVCDILANGDTHVLQGGWADCNRQMVAMLHDAEAERDALRKRIDDAPVGHPVSVDFSEMTLTVTIPNGFRTNGWPFALVPLDDAEAMG